MHDTLKKWLEEMDTEISIVQSEDIITEAQGNQLSFGVSEDVLNEWGQQSVLEFITGCKDLYRSKKQGRPMQFYVWFDEQAGQLRVSAVSSRHQRLPFDCAVYQCSITELVEGLFSGFSGLYSDNPRLNLWVDSI